MIDGHIFVDAYFTDEERKTLETVWFNPDSKEYNSHIIIAEEGDSEWEKFLKPEDLISIQKKYNLKLDKINGMSFNILKNEWSVSDDKSVNYIAKFIKN